MSYDAVLKLKAHVPVTEGANAYTSLLLRGMAHKMNNVLTIFHGYSSLLLSLDDLNETLTDGLEEIRKGAEMTSDLLDRTLNAAREAIPNVTQTNVQDVCLAAVQMVQKDFPEHTFEVDCPAALEFPIDIPILRQALVPLLQNAAEATPEKKCALLRVTGGGKSDLILSVVDTGNGMDPSMVEEAFQPFFTTKKAMGCLGLGLSISRRVAEGLQAEMSLASAPEVGTRVDLRIPFNELSSS